MDKYCVNFNNPNFLHEAELKLKNSGFVVVKNIFEDSLMNRVNTLVEQVLQKPSINGSFGYYQKDYAKSFYDPFLIGEDCFDLILNMSVIQLVKSYLEGEFVLAEANLKHDFGVNDVYFPLHADFSPGWSLKSDIFGKKVELTPDCLINPIAVGGLIYLHKTDEGAFCYSVGSHVMGAPKGTSVKNYSKEKQLEIEKNLVRITGECGDLVLFDDRGFHGPHQPTNSSRKVLLFDYYKLQSFNGKTKTQLPVLANELGRLNEEQLKVLGLGLKPMIPFREYHTRSFSKSKDFGLVQRLSSSLFNFKKYKKKLKSFIRR